MVEFLNEPKKDPLYIRIMKVVSFYWLLEEALYRTYYYRKMVENHDIPRSLRIKTAISWILNFPFEVLYYDIIYPIDKFIGKLRRKIYTTEKEKILMEVFGSDCLD